MHELKAWEKRVSHIMIIDDPKERELVDRFNKAFTQIFKLSARAEKRALVEMLRAADYLLEREVNENCMIIRDLNYEAGYKAGYLDGLKASVNLTKSLWRKQQTSRQRDKPAFVFG